VIDTAGCIAKSGTSREPYWENSAADVLAGLILLLFEYAEENEIHFKSLRALRKQAFISCGENTTYIQENFLKNLDKSSFLCSLLSGTAELNDHTRSCIISEFDQAMRPFFCQDNLIDMLSGNDIEMGGIGTAKTAVFLIVPDENTLYNALISVFVKQCYSELLNEATRHPKNRLPVRVNFLLDEFSNLPAIGDFSSMITASRSRNIRFNLIIQNQNQLVKRYGYDAETIKANCENWVFLHSREYSLLNEIVNLTGMKNPDEPLISMSTLQTLDKNKGEALVIHKRFNPYIAHLLDIDQYPNMTAKNLDIPYPETASKATAVFDFEKCCRLMANQNTEQIIMPSDKELQEIENWNPQESIDGEEKMEPVSGAKPLDELCVFGVGRGWHGLVLPIIEEIKLYNVKNPGCEITINQIKEKYGTLRFYITRCPDYIDGMISIAEKESGHICEICGARGKLLEIDGWWMTLCKRHIKAKKESNYDTELFKKLYRIAADTYNQSRWNGGHEDVILRSLKKENWFTAKTITDGKIREIKLERENKRSNLYVKKGKKRVKHEISVQWVENEDKSLHEGYWYVIKDNEKVSSGIIKRKSAEKASVKEIFSRIK
jgi:hypothetical protein